MSKAERKKKLAAKLLRLSTNKDGSFIIHEGGRNGSLVLTDAGMLRNIIKTFGRTDEQFIPWASVVHVAVDRRMGSDIVAVHTAAGKFEWKTGAAEAVADAFKARHAVVS